MNIRNLLIIGISIVVSSCASFTKPDITVATVCESSTSSSNPTPSSLTAFNIPLGTHLTLPECGKSRYGNYSSTSQICFERMSGREMDSTPVCNEQIKIVFPIAETPDIVKGQFMLGQIIDGNLEGIGFNTLGYSSQADVLDTLKNKYGDPTAIIPRTVRNGLGASYETFTAAWQLDSAVVTFYGIMTNVNSGLVKIDTTKAEEQNRKLLEELKNKSTPL